MQLNAVSVDLSKSVFQLSVTNTHGKIVDRKRLSRDQFQKWLGTHEPIRLVMEGCATCHYWGRVAEGFGHEAKILHPKYVKAYVRRNKTDAADADALIRADRDQELFAVAVKSEAQQAMQGLHCIRERWVRTRTACINEVRGLFGEFGIVLAAGVSGFAAKAMSRIGELPSLLQASIDAVVEEILSLNARIKQIDHQLKALACTEPTAQALMEVPGVGVNIATATLGRVPNMHAFKRGRSFGSWMGLTAKEHSSGHKRRLGSITKAGDTRLRVLYIHGARSALLAAKRKQAKEKPLTALEVWAIETEARVGHNKAAVALANKMARIIWVICTRGERFDGNYKLKFEN